MKLLSLSMLLLLSACNDHGRGYEARKNELLPALQKSWPAVRKLALAGIESKPYGDNVKKILIASVDSFGETFPMLLCKEN